MRFFLMAFVGVLMGLAQVAFLFFSSISENF